MAEDKDLDREELLKEIKKWGDKNCPHRSLEDPFGYTRLCRLCWKEEFEKES